jgi:GTP:adenosylcobinamide-phosphate guanylyltransferase
MNVIVTAGGCPRPDEPLYPLTRGGNKALLDVAGRPMVQRVLDALNAARQVERIVLVGLPPETNLESQKLLTLLSDQGDMLANIQAGARELARQDPSGEYVLVCSSDIPAISGEMVDWLAGEVLRAGADLCYNVIERKVMEARFPGSRRTYVHLKNMEVCGGDLNAARLSMALGELPFWKRLIEARKNPLRQAAMVGFDTLILLLLRQLSLAGAEATAGRKMGLRARALICPYAEMGMDVDKPFQLELMNEALRPTHSGG